MFTAREIKEMVDAQPFRPFRIHMSDGSSYEVSNHDAAMVTRHFVEVGVNPDRDGILERIVRCAILHISRVEETQVA
ncbi:MAG TPA: hypothetical protein PKA41_08750 [Verrucomicrobiota bacterium]|nr:hypothetical protein [Verrucomicrobiota bacterium]